MLYITTRGKFDPQTATRALCSDRGSDGGLYIPMQMPVLSREEIGALGEKSFGQRVADMLNLFFSTGLTGIDVDFAIGRMPVKLTAMNHRILMAEAWRNIESDYSWTELVLAQKICTELSAPVKLTSWLRIAIRIAVVFGIFGELIGVGLLGVNQNVDVAVPTEDFTWPVTMWYCRELGLPIGNIICACNENSGAWDLLHLGELHMDAARIDTTTPLADFPVPFELERLLHGVSGFTGAQKLAEAMESKKTLRPEEDQAARLRRGMFAAVVSRSRLDALIPSVYRTNSYILGPYTALAYGGLMDYRAKTGESRPALLLASRSPMRDADIVADSMRMTKGELKAAMDRV